MTPGRSNQLFDSQVGCSLGPKQHVDWLPRPVKLTLGNHVLWYVQPPGITSLFARFGTTTNPRLSSTPTQGRRRSYAEALCSSLNGARRKPLMASSGQTPSNNIQPVERGRPAAHGAGQGQLAAARQNKGHGGRGFVPHWNRTYGGQGAGRGGTEQGNARGEWLGAGRGSGFQDMDRGGEFPQGAFHPGYGGGAQDRRQYRPIRRNHRQPHHQNPQPQSAGTAPTQPDAASVLARGKNKILLGGADWKLDRSTPPDPHPIRKGEARIYRSWGRDKPGP